jgi:rhamnosyltransferase
MEISVIIPTLQAEQYLPTLLASLATQTLAPAEIIIVDSSSTDKTIEIAHQYKCSIQSIAREEFQHGRSRNIGAKHARGEILIFLTQDALPANNLFLAEIIQPILDGSAQAVTARQMPNKDASPTEKIAREFNYPPLSNLRNLELLNELGVKTFFFSNTASAIMHEVFNLLGGFSEQIIVNEDMDFCIRLLEKGYTVAYQAQAQVYHSHNYTLFGLFKRYFDIGVYFSQAPPILQKLSPNRDGRRLMTSSIEALVSRKDWFWLIHLLAELVVKFSAYNLGKHHDLLPRALKPLISGQTYYWVEKGK